MNSKNLVVSALGLFSLLSCAGPSIYSSKETHTNDASKLSAAIQSYTEAAKHLDPFSASYFNVEEDLGKFGDYASPQYFKRAKSIFVNAVESLKTIRPETLSEEDHQTYLLFKQDMEVGLKGFDFPDELLAFNQMGNRLHSYLDDSSEALTSFPFDSVKHYEDFISRSEGFPDYIENQIRLLKRGIAEKITLNCPAANGVLNTYKDALETRVDKNPFFRPIQFMPKSFSKSDRKRIAEEFRAMISKRILPGYLKFDRFFKSEYLPHCRKGFGIGSLPRGKEWYAFSILASTNLPLTPEQVHKKGLEEVARISREMSQIQKELGFKGTLKAFQKSLKSDPKYFFTSSEEMFKAFEKVKAEVNSKVPHFFSLIPEHDFKIVETSNPEDAAGSYGIPTENLPYGRFIVNTKNLRSVAKYGVTTLMLHETVPGHHIQIALQFEMNDRLSEYQRKLFFSNSFVEGWALYSEFLGNEMGMYSDPMQRLGNLNDEMLRAVRLVVDTGIHAYGWSREKANRYMQSNLATDAKGISNEVNRYSVWPGQALGYKIGQLKIIELRNEAKSELGSRFDIKAFHKIVIGNGTLPLNILEMQVREWIKKTKALPTI